MAAELRKRRTPLDVGLPDAVEKPQIDDTDRREPPHEKVNTPSAPCDQRQTHPAAKDRAAIDGIGAERHRWERPVHSPSWLLLLLLTIAAFATRLYRIHKGDFVLYGAPGDPC